MSPILMCLYLSRPEVLAELFAHLGITGEPFGVHLTTVTVRGEPQLALRVGKAITILPVPAQAMLAPCIAWADGDSARILVWEGMPDTLAKQALDLANIRYYWFGEGLKEWAAQLKPGLVGGGL